MLTEADEREHPGVAAEAWWWWGWADDRASGLFVGLVVRGRRLDYRAGLARDGGQLLYVEELDGIGRRAGLEVKPPVMWAGHDCTVPYRQWNLGNEAHGVLLDDPRSMIERPYGELTPVSFDVEWHASSPPVEVDGGYEQPGEIDAVVELREGKFALRGAGYRLHLWRTVPPAAEVLTRAGFLPPESA